MKHVSIITSKHFPVRRTNGRNQERGAALILALSLLALFAALGTLYVRHMNIELEAARNHVRQIRADNLAEAGMRIALADFQKAMETGRQRQFMNESHTYDFPTYRSIYTGEELALEATAGRRAAATVTVLDESGKINLNHAPASVLQAVLGVDGATARRITSSRPRGSGGEDSGRRWLLGIEDLLDRELLTQEQYDLVDPSLVTTHTVIDNDGDPQGYININAAKAKAMAAVLDVPLKVAEGVEDVAAKQRFNSLPAARIALFRAAGKGPAKFNIRPDYTLPPALSVSSRCFRLVSESTFARLQGQEETKSVHGYVEAVVLFDENGDYAIVRWSEQRRYEAT